MQLANKVMAMTSAVVITGASRSFGRCLALDFAREIADGDLDIFLWARHEQDLRETERLVQQAWREAGQRGSRTLRTFVQAVDLGQYADYAPKVDALLKQLDTVAYAHVYLVHNAGSLGELGYSHEWASHDMLTQYLEFNVTSVLWLDKRFLEQYGASRDELRVAAPASPPHQLTIVNVTSLCAIEPFSTHGLYCTGKAAREMHLRVVAKEQPAPRVRVLSYSPGPMDTGMQQTIRESPQVDPALSAQYGKMFADGTLVAPHVSSRLGVRLALSGAFESGAHIDYYDIASTTS